MTSIVNEKIVKFIECKDTFPLKQKGWKKKESYGSKDQLRINRIIMENCRYKLKKLSVAWIDSKKVFDSEIQENEEPVIYFTSINTFPKKSKQDEKCHFGVDWFKKANNTVPESWIIDYFKMYKISDNIIKFIEETMINWTVELTAEEKV